MFTNQPFHPTNFQMHTADGREFDIDPVTGITDIADANGNNISIRDWGISHSAGQNIRFERDVQGRITRITDPVGHRVDYTTDAHDD